MPDPIKSQNIDYLLSGGLIPSSDAIWNLVPAVLKRDSQYWLELNAAEQKVLDLFFDPSATTLEILDAMAKVVWALSFSPEAEKDWREFKLRIEQMVLAYVGGEVQAPSVLLKILSAAGSTFGALWLDEFLNNMLEFTDSWTDYIPKHALMKVIDILEEQIKQQNLEKGKDTPLEQKSPWWRSRKFEQVPIFQSPITPDSSGIGYIGNGLPGTDLTTQGYQGTKTKEVTPPILDPGAPGPIYGPPRRPLIV